MISDESEFDIDPQERTRLLTAVSTARTVRTAAQRHLEDAVVAAWEAGIGPTEISAYVGITNRTWVYRALRKAGWDPSGR